MGYQQRPRGLQFCSGHACRGVLHHRACKPGDAVAGQAQAEQRRHRGHRRHPRGRKHGHACRLRTASAGHKHYVGLPWREPFGSETDDEPVAAAGAVRGDKAHPVARFQPYPVALHQAEQGVHNLHGVLRGGKHAAVGLCHKPHAFGLKPLPRIGGPELFEQSLHQFLATGIYGGKAAHVVERVCKVAAASAGHRDLGQRLSAAFIYSHIGSGAKPLYLYRGKASGCPCPYYCYLHRLSGCLLFRAVVCGLSRPIGLQT